MKFKVISNYSLELYDIKKKVDKQGDSSIMFK